MPKAPIKVQMITSAHCDRCKVVEKRILSVASKLEVSVVVEKIDSTNPKAIELGIEYGLCDVPSFVISGCTAISGSSFSDEELAKAIRNAEAKRRAN